MEPRKNPDLFKRRPRQVQQEKFEEAQPMVESSDASQDQMDELIKDINSVSDKANRVFEAASVVCNKKKIPVPKDLDVIRTAVDRIDPNSDGSFISFDLYTEMKNRSNEIPDYDESLKFAGELTGIRVVDATKNDKSKHKNIPKLNFMAHLALLLLGNKLLAGPNSIETAKQTSQKEPRGAEAAGVLSSWAVTLSILYAMHKMDPESNDFLEYEDIAKQIGNKELNELKEYLEEDEASSIRNTEELLSDYYRDTDWSMAEQYADDYLINTNEPGYEDWFIASEARQIDREMKGAANQLGRWADVMTGGQISYNRLPNDTYKYHRCHTNHSNLRLDMLAAALHDNYAADMVCCLVLFLGSDKIDTDGLKALRSFLNMLLKAVNLDLGKAFNNLSKAYHKKIGESLLKPIFHEIRKLFATAGDKIKKFLSDDDEKWKLLFACTPVDEMFTYLLRALKHLERLILKMLKKMWNDMRKTAEIGKISIGHVVDKKRLTQMIAILNGVIKAIDKGNLCVKADTVYPPSDEAKKVAELLLGELPQPPKLDLPDPEDPYADFLPVAFDTPMGIRVKPVTETSKYNYDIKEVSPKDCIKRMTQENAVPLVITDKEKFNVKDLF